MTQCFWMTQHQNGWFKSDHRTLSEKINIMVNFLWKRLHTRRNGLFSCYRKNEKIILFSQKIKRRFYQPCVNIPHSIWLSIKRFGSTHTTPPFDICRITHTPGCSPTQRKHWKLHQFIVKPLLFAVSADVTLCTYWDVLLIDWFNRERL